MKGSKEVFLEMQQQGVDIDCSGNMYQESRFSASNYPLGAEHSVHAPYNEKEEFECTECGNAVNSMGMTCSVKCHENSMR